MSASAGNAVSLNVGGTSTAMVAEAMGGTGAGPYQVTNSAKRVLTPSVALTFYDNAVAIDAADILTIDYFFGKVTFTGSKTGPITVTGEYTPLLTVAKGTAYSVEDTIDVLDTTAFEDGADRTFIYGLRDMHVTMEVIDTLLTDLDSGGGTQTWKSMLAGLTAILLDIDRDGLGTSKCRCWALITKETTKGQVDGLVTGSIELQRSVVTAANGDRLTVGYGS